MPKYEYLYDNGGSISVRVSESGNIIFSIDNAVAIFSPEEAVDLATKIINHCYPYTTGQKI